MIEVTERSEIAVARAICQAGNVRGFECACPHPVDGWCLGGRVALQAEAAILAMRALELKPEPRLSIRETLAKQADAAASASAYQPAEELAKSAHLWVDRTKPFSALDEIARSNRRLDAIQALVLVLAARSPGYPPGDATLTQLIAELENVR